MPADAEMQFEPYVPGFPRRARATSGCSRLAVRVKMGWLPRPSDLPPPASTRSTPSRRCSRVARAEVDRLPATNS